MVFPLRDVPEQDPSRTGFEGTAAAPAPAAAPVPAPEEDTEKGSGEAWQGSDDRAAPAQADPGVRDAQNPDAQNPHGLQGAQTAQAGPIVQAGPTVQADEDGYGAQGAPQAADGVAYAPPPPSLGSTGGGAPAGDSAGDVAGGEKWRQIVAMFVDDPRGSVTEAAGLVDEAISAFVAAARGQQASLASSWKDQEAGTEELRKALQEYRTFWRSVTGLSLATGPGRPGQANVTSMTTPD